MQSSIILLTLIQEDNMKILNLTQHPASKEQIDAGVIDLPEKERLLLKCLLTFDSIPSQQEMVSRAQKILKLSDLNALGDDDDDDPYFERVMIGGAPFFMSTLERELDGARKACLYAFTKRIVEEKDGVKKSVFRHEGFVGV